MSIISPPFINSTNPFIKYILIAIITNILIIISILQLLLPCLRQPIKGNYIVVLQLIYTTYAPSFSPLPLFHKPLRNISNTTWLLLLPTLLLSSTNASYSFDGILILRFIVLSSFISLLLLPYSPSLISHFSLPFNNVVAF